MWSVCGRYVVGKWSVVRWSVGRPPTDHLFTVQLVHNYRKGVLYNDICFTGSRKVSKVRRISEYLMPFDVNSIVGPLETCSMHSGKSVSEDIGQGTYGEHRYNVIY